MKKIFTGLTRSHAIKNRDLQTYKKIPTKTTRSAFEFQKSNHKNFGKISGEAK